MAAYSAPDTLRRSHSPGGGRRYSRAENHRDQSRAVEPDGLADDSGAISVSPPSAALPSPESLVLQTTS